MINFKILQKTIIATYRLVMMIVLFSIIAGVLSYLFMIIFYMGNKNWSAPIVLSPTQEKVLAFQSQVVMLEATLRKNKVELDTTSYKYTILSKQVTDIETLIARFHAATRSESGELRLSAKALGQALRQKQIDTVELAKAAQDAQPLLTAINDELSAGLITKDTAISRRMAVQSMRNAAIDSQISQLSLQEQRRQASNISGTLGHDQATSLSALQSLNSESQLKLVQTQVSVDMETARQSIDQLRATVAENERVLDLARHSPYYMALTQPTSVAFVPYGNIHNAKPGATAYACILQIIFCRRVGIITQVYDAEEYTRHPLFKTDIKGRFVGINFDQQKSAESYIIFLGHRPLLF